MGNIIKNSRGNIVVWGEDKNSGEKKEIKKDFIIIQEGKKVDGRVAFKEGIYSERAPEEVTKILDFINGEGKDTCITCGELFYKKYKNLQQASYPFVTKIKSLGGVRSYKDGEAYAFREYYTNFCPKCYLLGILVWADDALVYRTFPRDKSILLLPVMDSLRELSEFKERYRKLLLPHRYSNLRVSKGAEEVENTPGEYSTLLRFYERFFVEIEEPGTIATTWSVVHIPLGSVKNIKFDSIALRDEIINIMREIVGESGFSIYGEILKNLYFFKETPTGSSADWESTAAIREKLSEYFIKDDFRHFTRQLLPRKGGHVGFSREARQDFEELIFIWRWKRMGIPKENLETIKNVGYIVAKASEKNLRLLYKLDKTKNLKEFWSVLREVSRKMVGLEAVRPTSLDKLVQLVKDYEKEWTEIRDLLVVYSSMYYSIKSKERGGESE